MARTSNDLLEIHYNKLVSQTTIPNQPFGQDALKSIISDSTLSNAFFSEANIQGIQDTIRYRVYKDTKKVIGNQSEYDLLIVMRSIYLQYSDNTNDDIRGQIADLNKRVIEYAVPTIITSLRQHMEFLKNKDKLPYLMDHPKNVSSAGTKDLASNKRFL